MFEEKIITKTGYIQTSLPIRDFLNLVENINNTDFDKDFNGNLAGQIANEKKFNIDLFSDNIKKMIGDGCVKYLNIFGHEKLEDANGRKYELKLQESWINFQQKGEYNPLHNHNGDLVFVLWVQIPYELQDELNHPSCKRSNCRAASCFEFSVINDMTNREKITSKILVDKSYEGKMIIFHSKLQHLVYPFFTSDESRISISGNFDIIFKDE